MKSDVFKTFSLLIERYPIEIFTFEILIGVLIEPTLKMAVLLFTGVVVAAVFSEGLKMFFKGKRPEEALKRNFYKRTFRMNKRHFPSSHSAVAMFFPTVFFGNVLFIPFLLFAAIVMYSRLYIKSHYPRDIIVGAAIGVLIGIFFMQLAQNLKI